jgi:putative SOS response-associated peptidase YedK
MFFCLTDDVPFAFAGVFERWGEEGQALDTCAFLTRGANAVEKPIHKRMPVMLLTSEDFAAWLDGVVIPDPTDPALMTALAVGSRVNSPRNEGPECLEPAA